MPFVSKRVEKAVKALLDNKATLRHKRRRTYEAMQEYGNKMQLSGIRKERSMTLEDAIEQTVKDLRKEGF